MARWDQLVTAPDEPDPIKGSDATAEPETSTKSNEAVFFLKQIPGLWAGRPVPTYPIGDKPPGSLEGASPEDLRLILDVATRQLQQAEQQLEQIRQRSQFLFTTLIALVGATVYTLRTVIEATSVVGFLVWTAAALTLFFALLGATGVIVNSKLMGELDSRWLSRQSPPWLSTLAKDALDSVLHSRTTVANQLTYFRDSALLTIFGVLLLAASWTISVL
jgi:hypothetical protein